MSEESYPIRQYAEWSQDKHLRWTDAGNTFGSHLLQYVRDNAVSQIIAETAADTEQARRAIDVALRTLMDLLDGYYRPTIDESHWIEYVLLARVRDADNKVVEIVELAPEGDGLAMGYAGWERGNFGQNVSNVNRSASSEISGEGK